ncbi:MAG: PleD family two-component system response regulator [Hyphomicrobiaceae bacterium]
MTARVLIVDDVLANVKLLEARLSAEYLEILTAYSGPEALDICTRERVDVVLLDVMMPGMDGFEVCRRLKQSPGTMHVPVIMVTALDQPADKVHGLDAGADDFLTKPVDDIALVTRVKNLARLKLLGDELAMRTMTAGELGLPTVAPNVAPAPAEEPGRIIIVEDHERSAARMREALARSHSVMVVPDLQEALLRVADTGCDLLMVSLNLSRADGLRLCSQVRALERTRHLPMIVLLDPGDDARLLRALDMGVNDYLMRPIDRNEMLARVRTQIRRKRHADQLRMRLERSVELAIIDPLTGLHNRRYMEGHLRTLVAQSIQFDRPLSVLIADIDHFKAVNDTWGHDIGDKVLREFATRFKSNIRGIDLACRLGGEEFLSIMPDTDMQGALQVGERVRACISGQPFDAVTSGSLHVTASVGLATLQSSLDTPETLFKRADEALYAAKREGRNRVMTAAA